MEVRRFIDTDGRMHGCVQCASIMCYAWQPTSLLANSISLTLS